jgi:hypothetical protein
MFGFGEVECPVEPDLRDWMEGRFAWLVVNFGEEPLLRRPVITPTDDFFPFGLDGSEDAARRMFALVCKYMDVDPTTVSLEFYDTDEPVGRGHIEIDWSGSGAAGTYQAQGKTIAIRRDALNDPLSFIATSAHELGHEILLNCGFEDADEEDHEPLTDLFTVYRGLGIFGANASLNERQYEGAIGMSGWGYSRTGYLDFPMWGYAHALLAYARDEAKPPWARHLRLDVHTLCKQGLKYLHKHGLGAGLEDE